MNILLAITFVFGPILLISKQLKYKLCTPFIAFFGVDNEKNRTSFEGFLLILDLLFFYFSLIFQAWYWLFRI